MKLHTTIHIKKLENNPKESNFHARPTFWNSRSHASSEREGFGSQNLQRASKEVSDYSAKY